MGIGDVDVLLCSIAKALDLGIRTPPGLDSSQLGPAIAQTKTSADGSFTLENLASGEYALLVWTPDYLPIEKHCTLKPGKNEVQFQAEGPSLTISGQTIGEDQKPIEGVELIALRGLYDESAFRTLSDWELLRLEMFSEAEKSEADGRFVLRGLPEGFFEIYASAPGYAQQSRSRVQSGSQDLVITMVREAKLSGFIRNELGQPIAGARVTTNHYYGGGNLNWGGKAESNAEGRYELAEVKTGGLTTDLFAEAEGFARTQIAIPPFHAGEERVFDVVLKAAKPILGRVIDRKGNGVPGAQIFFADAGKLGFANLQSISSDSEGRFMVAHTEAGKPYLLQVMKEGFEGKVFQPIPGGKADLLLTLQPIMTLAGQLVAENGQRDFPAFSIETFSEDEHGVRSNYLKQDFPAGDGSFLLRQVTASQNGLIAWVSGYAPAQMADFQAKIEAKEEKLLLSIPLQSGKQIRGRVIDATTKAPVAATVDIVSQSRAGKPHSSGRISVPTESNGQFSLDGAASGISIRAPGYARHVRTLSAAPAEREIDLGDIPLFKGGAIRIRASDEVGAALPGVEFNYRRGSLQWVHGGFSDAAGMLTIADLEPGECEIMGWNWKSAFESGRPYAQALFTQVVEGAETPVEFPLRGGGTLRGLVSWGELSDSYQAPDAAVYLTKLETVADGPQPVRSGYWASVSGLGEYWIPHVPPGRYLASVKSFFLPQRYDLSREVTIELGRETRLDFVAIPSGLAGEIRDAQSNDPIGSAKVQVLAGESGGDEPVLYSQPDGSFGIIGLRDGRYRLRVFKTGFATEDFGPFAVQPNRLTDGIRISLIPEGLLQVIVSAKSGAPVPGALVKLTSNQKELAADAGGSVVFGQLKPGPYELQIQAAGYAKRNAGPATVEAGKQKSLYVHLRKLCKLTIKLQSAAALPPGLTLTLIDQETGQAWPAPPAIANGTATINDLPEGAWKIQASGAGLMGETLFEVTPGAENQATVALH